MLAILPLLLLASPRARACPDPAALPAPPEGQAYVDAEGLLPALAAAHPDACPAIEVDLDADGALDLAALTRDAFLPEVDTLVVRLSGSADDPAGGWRALASFRALDGDPRAWVALRVKPADEAVQRDGLSAADRRTLAHPAAIEVLVPAAADSAGRPTSLEPTNLGACSTWYAWGRKGLWSGRACD